MAVLVHSTRAVGDPQEHRDARAGLLQAPRGRNGQGGAGPGLGKASWKPWVGHRPEECLLWGLQHMWRLTEGLGSRLIFKGNV